MHNKLAWIIAMLVGSALAIFILWLTLFPQPTAATSATAARGRLQFKEPAAPVTLVLPTAPSGPGDAGDDYKQAIDAYAANRQAIKAILKRHRDMIRGNYRPSHQDLLTLEPVRQAAGRGAAKAKMTYYFRHTPRRVEPPFIPEMSSQFRDIWEVLVFLSDYNIVSGEAGYGEAERCLLDAFTMGWHVVAERSRLDIVRTGFRMQKGACDELIHLYGVRLKKSDRLAAVQRYRDELALASITYRELEREVLRHLPPHSGDVFNLAQNHADKAVRRMATLWLGVVRLTCTKRGDKRYVRKLIADKLNSDDEIERACADAARKFDQKAFNLMKRPP